MTEPKLQRTPRYAIMVDGRPRLELGVFRKVESARELVPKVIAAARRPQTVTVRRVWVAL